MSAVQLTFYGLPPKEGTLERTLLDLLEDAGPQGIPFDELSLMLGINAEILEDAIRNLHTGMYESEYDDELDYDA